MIHKNNLTDLTRLIQDDLTVIKANLAVIKMIIIVQSTTILNAK